jgi:tetratricopeptide (TPR) repeat protein
MLDFLRSLLAAIPAAAASPSAFAAYAMVVAAYVFTVWQVTRNRSLLENLEKLAPKDRVKALEIAIGGVRLRSGISPEQWVRSRIHRYYLFAFLATCAVIVAVFGIASLGRTSAIFIGNTTVYQNQYQQINNNQLLGDAQLRQIQQAIDLATQRQFDRALDAFNRVPEAARVAAYWNDVGAVREGLDDREDARLAYQKALELRPDFAPAKVNLARLNLARLDAPNEAKAETRPPGPSSLVNMLSPYQAGQDVRVPSAEWIKIVSGKDDDRIDLNPWKDSEAIFPLRDAMPAVINVFAVLISEQAGYNPKDIGFFAGDSAGGEFRLVRQCTFENILMLNMPYQECTFPETTARYIKIKLLSNYGTSVTTLRQIRVLGRPAR